MTSWDLVRVKRWFIPERLWKALGQLPVRQPFRYLTTREVHADDALRSWSGEEER